MSTTVSGPQKLILIEAGNYAYAEVDLSGGSLQIVGDNNAGKTMLINALQFLYIDDLREMNFGAYTLAQTLDFYFPGQTSYALFECIGVRGPFVFGWRGQSKIRGGEPERFHYDGPFDRDDFVDELNVIREQAAVNDRLGVKRYAMIRSASEHRELLLPPTKGDAPRGLGLVALAESDQYPRFRDALKDLLCLNKITQVQMRDRLLMLAGLSAGGHVIDVRKFFGDDYEVLMRRKRKFEAIKKHQEQITKLVANHANRQRKQGEQMYLWTRLKTAHSEFQEAHLTRKRKLEELRDHAREGITSVGQELVQRRAEQAPLNQRKGALEGELNGLESQKTTFRQFEEALEGAILKNAEAEVVRLENQLEEAAQTTPEEAAANAQRYRRLITKTRATIDVFDRALITVLRGEIADASLAQLAQLFNAALLEQAVGADGVQLHDRDELVRVLRALSERIQDGVYRDRSVTLPLPPTDGRLIDLDAVRARLVEEEKTLEKWERLIGLWGRRDAIKEELIQLRGRRTRQEERIFQWKQFQAALAGEKRLKDELKQKDDALSLLDAKVVELEEKRKKHTQDESNAKIDITKEGNDYESTMASGRRCEFPGYQSDIVQPAETPPDTYDALITMFVNRQRSLVDLDAQVDRCLREIDRAVGSDFAGADESESIKNLKEELEALPDHETALQGSWEHHFHELRGIFARVLGGLEDVKSAAEALKRSFGNVQVSDLKAVTMDVVEHSDIVVSVRAAADVEQPGLFDDTKRIEATLKDLRARFEKKPLLGCTDLFTLRFTVTGADGKSRDYQDFTQVESNGTSIAVKVLFGLHVLRRLLRVSKGEPVCRVPFFLDEVQSLDVTNRRGVLDMADKLGFIAITAAPAPVVEVPVLYFLKKEKGRIVLRHVHRIEVTRRPSTK